MHVYCLGPPLHFLYHHTFLSSTLQRKVYMPKPASLLYIAFRATAPFFYILLYIAADVPLMISSSQETEEEKTY